MSMRPDQPIVNGSTLTEDVRTARVYDTTTLELHKRIEAERQAALPEADLVRTFRNYARGRQKSTVTSHQARVLRGVLGNLFCDNVCKRVLQELRNGLRLVRFAIDGDDDDLLSWLKTFWTLNKLGAFSAIVHWALMRDGNSAVTLGWNNKTARVMVARERWWNGKTGIFVHYDTNEDPDYAVKDWWDGRWLRRTIWYEDRIERYRMEGKGWQPYILPGDGVWPVPWTDRDGQPLGLPVVHFANTQLPNDGPGDDDNMEPDPRYGTSELDGGVLGIQDEINDVQRDLTAGGRFAGYPMYTATGTTRQTDDEGNELSITPEPGTFIEDANENARFDVLQPGSLAELERVLNLKMGTISRMTSVPSHRITGNWPSGQALARMEQPFADKIDTIATTVGPAWSSLAHKATRIANTFGMEERSNPLNEARVIVAVFAPVARRDPATQADYAEKIKDRVSIEEYQRQLGMSPDDITKIIDEMRQNAIDFPGLVGEQTPAAAESSGSTAAEDTRGRPVESDAQRRTP